MTIKGQVSASAQYGGSQHTNVAGKSSPLAAIALDAWTSGSKSGCAVKSPSAMLSLGRGCIAKESRPSA